MPEEKGHTLTIVELSHRDYLVDRYGPQSYKLLYEAFLERLAGYATAINPAPLETTAFSPF